MAYGDFKTLAELEKNFGLKNRRVDLFLDCPPLAVSENLKRAMRIAHELPIRSEKAKSELIVMPILLELRERNDKFFTIYSGDNLNVDDARGLKGECDFILAKETNSVEVSCPLLQVVEAKKNDMDIGIPQCAAQMLGAQLFNEQNHAGSKVIYGCVTTGDDWLFMKLDTELQVDKRKYYLGNLEELLGVFQCVINYFKAEAVGAQAF